MAVEGVLVDTGPLVAIFNKRDQHHRSCAAESKNIRGPFYTTWPVITEAAYLLKDRPDKVEKLLAQIRANKLRLLNLEAVDLDGVAAILARYSDQGFDLADASLMYLVERDGFDRVFTVDHRHFSLYRTSGGRPVSILPASL